LRVLALASSLAYARQLNLAAIPIQNTQTTLKIYMYTTLSRISVKILLCCVLASAAASGFAANKFVYRMPLRNMSDNGQIPPSDKVLVLSTSSIDAGLYYTTGLAVSNGSDQATYCVKGATADMAKAPAVLAVNDIRLNILAAWNYMGGFCLGARGVPPMPEGSYNITLVGSDNKKASGVITYVTKLNPAPTVTRVTPSMGSSAGTATVEVFGTGFAPGVRVSVDGMELNTQYVSATKLLVDVPPSSEMGRPVEPGRDAVVTLYARNPGSMSSDHAPDGSGGWTWVPSNFNAYWYFASVRVGNLNPYYPKAGDLVTLSGQGFFKNVQLKIGAVEVPVISYEDAASAGTDYRGSFVTFRMPNLPDGNYTLTVKVPNFEAVSSAQPITVPPLH
jgi:hypothetical protein